MAASPNASTIGLVSGIWVPSIHTRSKNESPPPGTPKSLGNCVMAMVSAAPALKPSRIVSLMKLTSDDSRSAQAMKLIAAKSSAASAAICVHRSGSPAAIPATVVPTSIEIADVGPMASWREVPNSAYAMPANR